MEFVLHFSIFGLFLPMLPWPRQYSAAGWQSQLLLLASDEAIHSICIEGTVKKTYENLRWELPVAHIFDLCLKVDEAVPHLDYLS